jgi:phosphotransferase system  glucose/maltose/N-acetylglucosamine-specific IIC component
MDAVLWGIGIAVIVILSIGLFIFWIKMLIDVCTRKFNNTTEQIIWVIVIALMHLLGALVYYFMVKKTNSTGLSKATGS